MEDKIIYKGFDNDEIIEVVDNVETRSLYFGNRTLQSREYFAAPHVLSLAYTKYLMAALLLMHDSPNNILIAGLGAGSLIKFLFHHYPNSNIQVVESSHKVINVAKIFFDIRPSKKLSITHDNWENYITRSPKDKFYDLIILDAFSEKGMCPNTYGKSSLPMCTKRLSTNGILACNLWSGNNILFDKVKTNLITLLPNTLFIPVKSRGNIVSFSRRQNISWKSLHCPQDKLQQLSQKYTINFKEILLQAKRYNFTFTQRLYSLIKPRWC